MKVKEVIASALNLLGRQDLAELLTEGAELNPEENEAANTLLYCLNAVEDELARRYIPLTASESMKASDGIFYFASFKRTPVNINKVLSDGVETEYEIFPQYMKVNAQNITVEYSYMPAKKKMDGTSDYADKTGEYLLALGMAAEYCLINGETQASEQWEEKYRARIDGVQSVTAASRFIPPRRWV